jgi:hypothetical protein
MDALYSDHRVVSDRTVDSHVKTCGANWPIWESIL